MTIALMDADLRVETDPATLDGEIARTFEFCVRLHVTAQELADIEAAAAEYAVAPETFVALRAWKSIALPGDVVPESDGVPESRVYTQRMVLVDDLASYKNNKHTAAELGRLDEAIRRRLALKEVVR